MRLKKTLATVLSLAMLLSLTADFFTFAVSAEQVEKPYAEQVADELWANAVIAEVEVFALENGNWDSNARINLGGYSQNWGNQTKDLASQTSGNGKSFFTSGTLSYSKDTGEFVLKDVQTAIDGISFYFKSNYEDASRNGGIKIDFQNCDVKVGIELAGENKASKDGATPLILHSSTDATIRLSGGNCLRNQNGGTVFYGGLNVIADAGAGGYHALNIVGASAVGKGYPIVVGCASSEFKGGGGNGAIIENRSGSIIFCGNGTATVTNTGSGTGFNGVLINNQAKQNSSVQILENANVAVNTVTGNAISNFSGQDAGNVSILANTSGTVKIRESGAKITAWNHAAVYAQNGAIRVLSGKLLVDFCIAEYSGACGIAIAGNNGGQDTDGGVYVANDAEVVVNAVSTADATNTRMAGIWTNYGYIKVSDRAKLTVRYEQKGKGWTNEFTALNVKTGALSIQNSAKVFVTGFNNTSVIGGDLIRVQYDTAFDSNATKKAYWQQNGGIHITGGQLEANGPAAVLNGPTNTTYNSLSHISGGVISLRDTRSSGNLYPFGYNPDAPSDTGRRSTLSNQVYAGPIRLNNAYIDSTSPYYNKPNARSNGTCGNAACSDWLYWGAGASYSYYDGIQENTDFFGDLTTNHNLFSDAQTFIVPTSGTFAFAADNLDAVGAFSSGSVVNVPAAVANPAVTLNVISDAEANEAASKTLVLPNVADVSAASDDTLAKGAASVSGFETVGAQIRTEGKTALRFVFRVSDQALSSVQNVSYGSLVAQADAVKAGEVLRMPAVSGTIAKGSVAVVPAVNTFAEFSGYTYYTAAVTGLLEANAEDTVLLTRPYISYEQDGVNYTYYYVESAVPSVGAVVGGGYAVSMKAVAEALVSGKYGESAENIEKIKTMFGM